MTLAILDARDREYVVVAAGTDLIATYVQQAILAGQTAQEVLDAILAAGLSEGVFPSLAAGESGTTDGQYFWVGDGGTVTLYLNDSGSGDEIAELATAASVAGKANTADLAADTGAEMIGTSNGMDVETRLANQEVSVKDFWQAGDPDWTNAFERAIYTAFPDSDCISIFVPVGDYILSRQIIPRRTVLIRGAGSTVTRLQFTNVTSLNATMKGAFAFGIETTLAAYTTNPEGYPVRPNTITSGGADQSVLSDICIEIVGTRPAGFDYCVWNSARLTMQNVLLYGGGLKVAAGALLTGGGTITGNSNCSRFTNVNSLFATEDAFHFDGADANNCEINRCSAFVPDNYGFFESSQFGNSYFSCHREGSTANTISGYKSVVGASTNGSVFVGCYNEADAVAGDHWDIASPGMIIAPTGVAVDILANANTLLSAANLAGLFTRGQFNWTASGSPYDLGSASIAASRMSPNGLQVRAGDNSIGAMERGGDGTYLTKDGASVMKIERGAAISNVSGGSTVDAECRTAVNAILARLRAGTPNIAT